MRPDSSCSPGVFKSSVDAELGAIGAASELSGTLVSELDVCAVVICWAKEVEQRWWWWWWHHLETMPRQTSESSNNIPQPPSCFSRLSCSLLVRCAMFCLQCKDTDTGAVSYSLFSFNAWSGVVFYPLILSRKCWNPFVCLIFFIHMHIFFSLHTRRTCCYAFAFIYSSREEFSRVFQVSAGLTWHNYGFNRGAGCRLFLPLWEAIGLTSQDPAVSLQCRQAPSSDWKLVKSWALWGGVHAARFVYHWTSILQFRSC